MLTNVMFRLIVKTVCGGSCTCPSEYAGDTFTNGLSPDDSF